MPFQLHFKAIYIVEIVARKSQIQLKRKKEPFGFVMKKELSINKNASIANFCIQSWESVVKQ